MIILIVLIQELFWKHNRRRITLFNVNDVEIEHFKKKSSVQFPLHVRLIQHAQFSQHAQSFWSEVKNEFVIGVFV